MIDSDRDATFGILHCGDMGSAVGLALRESNRRVVTTCEGRSPETEEQARSAGVEILPTVGDVVARSDIVFSLVLPSAAVEVARRYAECRVRNRRPGLFVEANAIGLKTLEQIDRVMARHGHPWVDAAIHGGAKQLRERGVLLVSGARAREIERMCGESFHVSWMGAQIGSASRVKLLLSGVSKTLVAMFLEIGILAERNEMLDSWLDNCQRFYPEIMTAVERMLPTYPRHALRRAAEVRELGELGGSFGLQLGVTRAVGEVLELVAGIDWDRHSLGPGGDLSAIIRAVGTNLEREPPTTSGREGRR